MNISKAQQNSNISELVTVGSTFIFMNIFKFLFDSPFADMLEGSMQVMSQGRDLLDRLRDLGSKAGDDSRRATMVSCQGVEKAM